MGETFRLASIVAITYTASYFWKTTVFVLPFDDDEKLLGMDPRSVFAILQTVGFGLSKPFAANYVSKTPPDQRPKLLAILLIVSAGFMGAAFPAFSGSLELQALCVFLAALPSSWLYGLLFTFMEGRTKTDIVVAAVFSSVVVAGGISRSAAQALLHNTSLSPESIILCLTALSLPVALIGTFALSRESGPSTEEQEEQGNRTELATWRTQFEFASRFTAGLALLIVFYATLSGFRAFRDFFAEDLFDAGAVSTSGSLAYLLVDMPGALLSFVLIASLVRIRDNRAAFLAMYQIMLFAIATVFGFTLLFRARWVSRKLWLSMIGLGTYVAYAPICTSMYDRLVAASHANLSCSFLLFYSDLCGYFGTAAWLVVHSMFPGSSVLDFFANATLVFCTGSVIILVPSMYYFHVRLQPTRKVEFAAIETDEL